MLGNSPDKFKVKSIEDIKSENRKKQKIKEIKGRKRMTFLFITLCVAILTILVLKLNKKSLVVFVNETRIGVVENNEELISIQNDLKRNISIEIGVDDIEFIETIRTEKEKYEKSAITPREQVMRGLREKLTYKILAYSLVIDGNEKVLLENGEQLDRILNSLRDEYYDDKKVLEFSKNEKAIAEYFYGSIEIQKRYAPKNEIMTDDAAIEILKKKTEEKTYKVKSNDTLWTISESNKIDMEQLLLANPGFTETEVLRPGQEINLSLPMAVLPVITYIETSYETVIEPPVEKILRNDQYEGFMQTIEEGKEGKKTVTVKKKMVDDVELQTEIVKEVETEPAVKKVIEIGAKKLPNKAQKGLFMFPTRGTITSTFMEARGGYNHKGLDIANARGTDIYCSYLGKVVLAGEKNGYGNCIIIEHSSGYQTLYGHLDEILVEKGAELKKGDLIGKMGSTGNSTGNHLHFEIIKDGVQVNPMDYLK